MALFHRDNGTEGVSLARCSLIRHPTPQKTNFEVIARNGHMNCDDKRDQTDCSLFYFALGKVELVRGLWRQAA